MQADFVLDYDVLTVEQEHKLYVMARFASGPAPSDKRRRPLNLSLVIDRSGSMAGDKISHTRHAAQFLVQNLGPQDILSIVLYNDAVEILTQPMPIMNKDMVAQRINTIKVGGTTNLSGGWLEGCKLAAQSLQEGRLNRVILMSDGHANRGVTDIKKLVTLASQKLEQGVSTTTMGLGEGFNEDLMMEMAEAGGGAFYFIESPEVAPLIFDEELQGLLSALGQNLVISIETAEYVTTVKQLNAYPTQSDGAQTAFRLGDIFGEEVKTLMLELSIPALQDVGEKQIATLRFEYDELTENGSEHRVKTLPIIINISGRGELPEKANREVLRSVLLLKAADARRKAVAAADKGDFEGSSRILREAAGELAQAQIEDEDLIEERQALLQQAENMRLGNMFYNDYSRKTMATQAFYTMKDRHTGTVTLRRREHERDEHSSPRPSVREVSRPARVTWEQKDFALDSELVRLGRASQNDIVIDARGVSRFHCQISRQGDNLFLEDLSSTNGTTVNGAELSGPHKLTVGDVVYLHDQRLVFRAGSSEDYAENLDDNSS